MINIYYAPTENIYIFVTPEWFSSDFDSLEQLIDVNLDDPSKILLADIENIPDMNIHKTDLYSDLVLLCTVNSLKKLNLTIRSFSYDPTMC